MKAKKATKRRQEDVRPSIGEGVAFFWPGQEQNSMHRVFSDDFPVRDEYYASVSMVYRPKRKPATVNLTVSNRLYGNREDQYAGKVVKEYHMAPLTPAQAREVAHLLIDAADLAEKKDRQPYPPPEDSVPPVEGLR